MIKFKSLFDYLKHSPSEQECINHLEEVIWEGKPPISPHDPTSKVYKCSDKEVGGKYPAKYSRYKCKNTGKYFTVKTGTILENSNIPLSKWFLAYNLFSSHKKSISSYQLAKFIEVTQKSAWFVSHRLKVGGCSIFNKIMLENTVEIDETFIGGKNKNRHWNKKVPNSQGRSWKDKSPVLVMIERGGKAIAKMVKNVKKETLEPIIRTNVMEGSTVNTDEWLAYNGLEKWYNHKIVNHGKGQYVNGEAHVNTAESFNNFLKGTIKRTHHNNISDKHLQKYLDENVFRFNTRKYSDEERFNLMLSSMAGKRLTYKQLTN